MDFVNAPRCQTRHIRFIFFLIYLCLSFPRIVFGGNSPQGDAAASWPSLFTAYTRADGTQISDPSGDSNPVHTDISTGPDGSPSSVFVATDGTHIFFRFRMAEEPGDPTRGGFKSTAWSVALGVNGVQTAVVGLDGKSTSLDFVYVSNANGSVVQEVYTYPFTNDGSGQSYGARSSSDGAGAFFLDFQVPISRITAVAPSITSSTPVQLFYGTSAAGNLSVINKDLMSGSSVTFTGLGTIRFQMATLSLAKTYTVVSGPNPPITNQTTTYDLTLTASNIGANGLQSISIIDTFPSYVTLVSVSTASGSISSVNRNVSWTPAMLLSGSSSTATIRVSVSPTSANYGQTLLLNPGASGTGSDMLTGSSTGTLSNVLTVGPVTGTPGVTISGGELVYSNDNTPLISGTTTAPSGRTVSVTIGTQTYTTTSQIGGTWSLQWPTTIADNSYTVSASVTAEGTGSDSQTLVIDTTPPLLAISNPTSSLNTGDNTPLFSGTGEPGLTVAVYIDGILASNVAVNGSGAWSYVSPLLADGSHSVYAVSVDLAGNSTTTSAIPFTVDTVLPTISMNNNTTITSRDNSPTISGTTSETGDVAVSVSLNGQNYTTLASGGVWTITLSGIGDSVYLVTASVADAAGNIGITSQQLIVDTILPAVAIDSPVNGQSIDDNTPLIFSGNTEPASVVILYLNGVPVDTLRTDAAGFWSYTSPLLGEGTHSVFASATDGVGNIDSTNTIFFEVDTQNPIIGIDGDGSIETNDPTPTLSGTSGEADGDTVLVTINGNTYPSILSGGTWSITWPVTLGDGNYTVSVTITDAAGNAATTSQPLLIDTTPVTITLSVPADGATTGDDTPLISGTSEAGSIVILYIDGDSVATIFVSGSGSWSYSSGVLAAGPHDVYAVALDDVGNSATSSTNSFTITGGGLAIEVNSGTRILTSDITPIVSGTTSASEGVTVSVTINGVTETTTVQAGGSWSIAWPFSLGEGDYNVTATVSEGFMSGEDSQTLTVDTTAPASSISSPAANAFINDPTPVLTGVSEPGTIVALFVDGVFIDSFSVGGSGAWSYNASMLTDGVHSVYTTSHDAAGNTAVSSTTSFTVDTTPPVFSIEDGTAILTNDPTPTITGSSGEPDGTIITVIVNGDTVSTTLSGGLWTVTITSPLADGSYIVTVGITDAAGNSSQGTEILNVDTTPPAVSLTTPTNGSFTSESSPLIFGSAEPSAMIIIFLDGSPHDTVFADVSGNWQSDAVNLIEGSHTLAIEAIDEVGNSTLTPASSFMVDFTAPSVILNNRVPIVSTDPTPTFSGTSTEVDGTSGRLIIGTDTVSFTVVGGVFSVNWPFSLSDGLFLIIAEVTDAASLIGSTSLTITIDTQVPSVVISSPSNGSFSSIASPTISGTGEAGSSVIVYLDGIAFDTVTVNGSGVWSTTSPSLADGAHTFYGFATDVAGNTATSPTVTYNVSSVVPAITIDGGASVTSSDTSPTISGSTDQPDGTIVSVTINGQTRTAVVSGGAWSLNWPIVLADAVYTVSASVTNVFGASTTDSQSLTVDTVAPSVAIASPADGSTVNDNTPSISGTTEPGLSVTVRVDGIIVGVVTADISGNWTVPVLSSLLDGSHSISASAADAAGNSSSDVSAFSVDTSSPSVSLTSPTDGSVTNDDTPVISGTAEPGSTVILSIDGIAVDTIVVPGSGLWSFTPDVSLTSGEHALQISAVDPTGNASTLDSEFTIDLTAPSVSLTSPVNNAHTNDNTPSISGTSGPGDTIKIYLDGVLVTSFVTGITGSWTFTPGPLTDGVHSVYATATDAGTNSSTTSSNTFTVDTIAPSITLVPISSTTNDNTPLFQGVTEPFGTVRLFVDGGLVAIFTANAVGAWSYQSGVLSDSQHTVTATAVDAAGNTTSTSPSTFTISTLPVLGSISPDSAEVCEGSFTLTVTGSNFFSNSIIRVNGGNRITTVVNSTTLTTQIDASELITPSVFSVTVFTPLPGGGTSTARSLYVLGGSISGTVFYDKNGNGVEDAGDIGISGWTLELSGTNPANDQTVTAGEGGVFIFRNLAPDTYTLNEVLEPGWELLAPSSGTHTVTIGCALDATGYSFSNTTSNDTLKYRTFTPLAISVKKSVNTKPFSGAWTFRMINTTSSRVNRLRARFLGKVCAFTSFSLFTDVEKSTIRYGTLPYEDPERFPGLTDKIWDFTGSYVEPGETVFVSGYSCRVVDQTINNWYWILDDSVMGTSTGGAQGQPIKKWDVFRMPNAANVREKTVGPNGDPNGLIVGVRRVEDSRNHGWVLMKKPKDIFRSLNDREIRHTGSPRGFARFNNGKPFFREQASLSPRKHDNKLFAELVALKFNITASTVGVTPPGFGELVFELPGHPLSGRMIKEIASYADTAMTDWQDFEGTTVYAMLDTTAWKLNNAFSGDIDTLTIGRNKVLTLSGVRSVSEVSFLRPNPSVPPVILPKTEAELADELPEGFILHQNYPNPFNPMTQIQFEAPQSASITITVFNILGQKIATLVDRGEFEEGVYEVQFDGTNIGSGVYFYQLVAESIGEDDEVPASKRVLTGKMLLVK